MEDKLKQGLEEAVELLNNLPDDEFMKLYKECENNSGVTIQEYPDNRENNQ